MALEIRVYPDAVLRQKAEEVREFGEELKRTADLMLDTMYRNKGLGLAGNQVGILKRIVVVDVNSGKSGEKSPLVLVNPEIVTAEGEIFAEEGCLSLPGLFKKVKRFAYVKLKAQNLEGEDFELEAEDLLARVFQHEIDHLNGVLFIDRLSPFQRRLAVEKYRKLRKKREAKR